MAREAVEMHRAEARAVCRPRVIHPARDVTSDRVDRMARFAAGARRVVVRAVAIGALVAIGWLFAVLLGTFTAAPAAAETTAAAEAAAGARAETGAAAVTSAAAMAGLSEDAQQSITGLSPGPVSASDNAEAMAGRTVNGLNSQQDPGLPAPSSAGKILDTNGLVPNGGGSGPLGPVNGDVARSAFDPRLQAGRAPLARLLPPVVRTAADDPSFSPD